jgi:hypothetical protein
VIRIHLPPLRERGEDVEALARHFLEQFARELGRPACASGRALARIAPTLARRVPSCERRARCRSRTARDPRRKPLPGARRCGWHELPVGPGAREVSAPWCSSCAARASCRRTHGAAACQPAQAQLHDPRWASRTPPGRNRSDLRAGAGESVTSPCGGASPPGGGSRGRDVDGLRSSPRARRRRCSPTGSRLRRRRPALQSHLERARVPKGSSS